MAFTPPQRSNTLLLRLPQRPNARHSLGSFDASSLPLPASDDVFFYHPSAKIVKFQLPQSAHTAQTSSSSATATTTLPEFDYPVDAVETLPWRSSTETTAAVGPLKIEHVAGSAAFLKSGSVVQALLKGCQSWCVDGESIFVLRIRKLTYYRIELPNGSEEDKRRVEALKSVLPGIIKYESTPCPFKRGFSVELPEEAKTPKRKKAWRPKHDFSAYSSGLNIRPRALSFSEGSSLDTELTREQSDRGSAEHTDGELTDGSWNNHTPGAALPRGRRHEEEYASPTRAMSLSLSSPSRPMTRNFTEPAPKFENLMAKFQPLPESDNELEPELDADADVHAADSLSSSVDSFHSFQTSASIQPPPSPRSHSPSPPPPADFTLPVSRRHSRELSEATVIPGPLTQPNDATNLSSPLSNSPQEFSQSLTIPPSDATLRQSSPSCTPSTIRQRIRSRKQQQQQKRELSPLPPSSTLYMAPSPQPPTTNFTTTILRNTCTYVLGPPIQLLLILLRIAASLASGSGGGGGEGEGYGYVVGGYEAGDGKERARRRGTDGDGPEERALSSERDGDDDDDDYYDFGDPWDSD